jgi:multidrug resistance efflux pump
LECGGLPPLSERSWQVLSESGSKLPHSKARLRRASPPSRPFVPAEQTFSFVCRLNYDTMTRIAFRILRLAIFALALAGCFAGYPEESAPAAATSSVLRVHRGSFTDTVSITGEVEAARGGAISVPPLPNWQSTVKWIAQDGSELREGDRVVELDNSSFVQSLEEKRRARDQAIQELAQKEAEWAADAATSSVEQDKKRIDYDKAKLDADVPREIVSARDYEERQTKLSRAKVEYEKARDTGLSSKAGVASDRANLRISLERAQRDVAVAEEAIQSLILTAPRAGVVVVKDHPWEGRKLQAGDTVWVGMPLALIPESNSLQVTASLADVDDRKITIGMPAVITLDAYPSLAIPGRITDISAVAQESARNSLRRAFRVVVTLDRIDGARMRPGLSARVVVNRATIPAALLASRAALDVTTEKAKARLRDGSLIDVTIGRCNAQECVVTDGLADGQELAPL